MIDHEGSVVDRVILSGAFVGGVGLLLPVFVVKEHRLDAGFAVSFVDLSLPMFFSALALVVAVALLATLPVARRWGRSASVVFAALCLFALLWAGSGIGGSELLAEYGFDRGRVSPSSGFWIVLLAILIIVTHSLKQSTSVGLRSFVPLLFVAILTVLFSGGVIDDLAFVREYHTRADRFVRELTAHIGIAAGAVGTAVAVGVPIGILAYRIRSLERPLFTLVNGVQTIPSLALFGLMIAPLALISQRYPVLRELGIRGVGNTPALLALFLYALLPIVRNTYTSLSVMDPAVIHAGTGMGMTRRQLMWQVEVPIALPIILAGVRVSMVQTIGNTTVAALIGAGGLGNFVFQGLGQAAPDLIVMGVIPIVMLALLADRIFQLISDAAVPGPKRGAG